MKTRLFFCLILAAGLFFPSCTTDVPQNETDATEAIKSIMQQQEKDWNEGSLEGFMSAYWKSDSLLFIGSRGLTYGWSTTLDNYRKSYKNKALMGYLVFENKEIETLGNAHAWAAGRWHLFRESDTLQGSYMLVWEKIEGQWKIVADHSSSM